MECCILVYRYAYWIKREIVKRFCPTEIPYEDVRPNPSSLPWFWIGMRYENDVTITVTDVVNHIIEYDMRVTPEVLYRITGCEGGTWKYIDAQTLEEKDFPSEGFIIEDVLDKQLSDSE
jgi:hypothetical protein